MPQLNLEGSPVSEETLQEWMKRHSEEEQTEVDEMTDGNTGNEKKGRKPDYRICKMGADGKIIKEKLPSGKEASKDYGAIWRNTSKAGKEYMTVNIKNKDGAVVKYLAFPNAAQRAAEDAE